MDESLRYSEHMAMGRWVAVSILLARLCYAQLADALTQRHEAYAQLNDQIFPLSHAEDRNFRPPPEAKEMEVRSQLHNLVMDQICSDLGQPHPSDEALRSDIAAVQGKMNLSVAWGKDEAGNLPFVSSFELNGVRTFAVGYAVAYGGTAIPASDAYLEFYIQAGGRCKLQAKAEIDPEYFGSSFFISPIDSGWPLQTWFLTWRKTFGDTGSRLRLRLYAFDGLNVRSIWERSGLIAGTVQVSNQSITLEYDREYRSSDPLNRARETLHIEPTGLR
jgi:hypothetical protein